MERPSIGLKFADVLTSLLIVAVSAFLGRWYVAVRALVEAGGFWGALVGTAAAFFAMFALGDVASIVYWHFRGESRVSILRSDKLQIAVTAAGILAIGIFYSIFGDIRPPYLAYVLAILVGLVFGFSFGVELKLESSERETDQLRRNRRLFDHSLKDNLPYAILLFAFVFPLDFFLETEVGVDTLSLVPLVALLAAYLWLSVRLARKGLGGVEIRLKNDPATVLVVVLLSLGGTLGFIYWDVTGVRALGLEDGSIGVKILALVFFGLVPVRMVPILFLKTGPINKILGCASLAFYVLRKTQIL